MQTVLVSLLSEQCHRRGIRILANHTALILSYDLAASRPYLSSMLSPARTQANERRISNQRQTEYTHKHSISTA
jgi:hypothetical protein